MSDEASCIFTLVLKWHFATVLATRKNKNMPSQLQRIWDDSIQPKVRRLGVDIRRYPPTSPPDWTETAFRRLLAARQALRGGRDISEADDFLLFCAKYAMESESQLFQDLFVRWQLRNKLNGFFVEFGATDGVGLSNSKSLEVDLGWSGILAEPARCWHESIRKNRHCAIDTRCVWTKTGETLLFNEVVVPELSTIKSFSDSDEHSTSRADGSHYEVETVSLNDLLSEHGAPGFMDYLSIDTEGSELQILENLDFHRYAFAVITVEHNYTDNREKIFDLLVQHGYQRKFTQFSEWDDWYVYSVVPQNPASV